MKTCMFIGILILAASVTSLPKWLREGTTSAPSWASQGNSGDIRVNTPDGKKYPGVAYFSEQQIGGKRYLIRTTYHPTK